MEKRAASEKAARCAVCTRNLMPETFVELKFLCKEKTYTIRRSPDYVRPKKRGEGIIHQGASVQLTFSGGQPPVTTLKEATARVTEIVGLDKDQFMQIAMIAQGPVPATLTGQNQRPGGHFAEDLWDYPL